METNQLGQKLERYIGKDAIHIAMISVKAVCRLYPGQKVDRDGLPTFISPVGIVDPFLSSFVEPEEYFWLCLFPKSITGMRHVWTHPDF